MTVTPVDRSQNLWRTPKGDAPLGRSHWTLNKLKAEFHLKLDPCAENAEAAMCDRYYTPDDDGLKWDWDENAIFNPPFSRPVADLESGDVNYVPCIGDWCRKAVLEAVKHNTINIGILPWYQSPWFIDHVWDLLPKRNIIPLGRVSYLDSRNMPQQGNRFDSFLALWDMRNL